MILVFVAMSINLPIIALLTKDNSPAQSYVDLTMGLDTLFYF